jgi:hypothetical protein
MCSEEKTDFCLAEPSFTPRIRDNGDTLNPQIRDNVSKNRVAETAFVPRVCVGRIHVMHSGHYKPGSVYNKNAIVLPSNCNTVATEMQYK